jgi:hypothetical protein
MKSIRIGLLAFFLSSPPILAFAYDVPRLWVAEKISSPKKKIYVLAASHFGLPVEYDEYYNKVAIPAFMQSDILRSEGGGGREPEPEPPCDESVLDEKGREIFQEARKLAAELLTKNLMHQYSLTRIDAKEEEVMQGAVNLMAQLDEFKVFEFLNTLGAGAHYKREKEASFDNGSRRSVDESLWALRTSIPYKDLDTSYGVRRAYCSTGNGRATFLQSTINSIKATDAEVKKTLKQMNEDFSFLLQNKKSKQKNPMSEPKPTDLAFLCGRNKEWLLEAEQSNNVTIEFWVVGAAHVFDMDNNFGKCGGVVTGLRNIGYKVDRID